MSPIRSRGLLAALFISSFSLLPARLGAAPAAGARGEDPPSIVGVVRDSAGKPLPSVQVVLSQLNRGTTTDAEGHFEFRGLRPGTYHIDAVLIGFAPAHQQVVVPAGATASVEMTLHVSAVQLAGVQITASPTGSGVLAVTQATTEVSGKELQRELGATVAQTLQSQPGMAVRYSGPAAAAPIIRGLTGERIVVLQNGDRTADLSAASADHALTVDPLAASRIEVVRGPASLLYGNNALGGVVNVITNATPTDVPDHVEGYFATQGQTVAPGGAVSTGLTVPLGSSLALTAQAGGRRLADVRVGGGAVQENTFSRDWHGTAGLGLIRGHTSAGGSLEAYAFRYGLPAAPGSDEAGVHLKGARQDAQARAAVDLGTRGLTDVEIHGTGQWYHHDEIEADGAIGTSFRLNTQTVQATSRTRFGRLAGQVGAEGLFRQYDATGEEALTPAANSNGFGLFFFQELPIRATDDEHDLVPRLQLGGRFDRYATDSKAGDPKFGPARSVAFGNVSGSVGVSLPFSQQVSLGVSVARAFRAPTIEELFSNAVHAAVGAYQVGNPDLAAETNAGFDAVLRAQSRRFSGQLSGYLNRINDYIAPIEVGDTTVDGEMLPLDVFQQADARIYGVEGKLEGEVARHIVLGVMGDALRGDFTRGGPLPFMPAARLGGSARWDDGRYSFSAEARHAFAQNRVSANETATGAYTLVDLAVGANLIAGGRVHNVTLRVDNLLDERYRDATSRIKDFALNPGRNVSLVYRVLF
ncbi:MAG TPA: TonB-dependent receptor [Longimicrobiales bacterium]|nr:TonB-dependent receptor [Longimicrobiales bacterium]